ncbi:MAG: DUF3291 domain-containing protein [Chitinophagaceae bacterium]|nr:DUF3291 domain-containing protein [Chitinophagaceae bacterium]
MAIHRLPLWTNKKIHFHKLLGCGKDGGFSKKPDWQQWAILAVRDAESIPDTQHALLKMLYGKFIAGWYFFWKCETKTFILEPLSGYGAWDKKKPFGVLPDKSAYEGKLAVLTRATIRLTKLGRFWAHVKGTSDALHKANGLVYSLSIGEMPFIKQATFSIWSSIEDMNAYAYHTRHKEVIQKTREEKWYSEELFVRFKILWESKENQFIKTSKYSAF